MNIYPIRCRLTAAAAVTRVDVYDDIGGGDWLGGGISAGDFTAQLAGVRGALDVHINSGGGDVFDGISISNAIRSHRGKVTTVVDGIAASIASVIAQAGQERVMAPGSMMMIHDAFGACMGNAAEMARMTETLNRVSDNIAGIYAARGGRTVAEWRDDMRAERWFTADEAVTTGLADRVGEDGAQLPPGLDLAAFAAPGRIAAALRSLPRAAASVMHGDHERYDPDGDGDCDACPEGDTDHDYWTADGKQKKSLPGRPMPASDGLDEDRLRAILREELAALRNADVDTGEWDADRAWHNGASSDDPAAFYAAICAGRRAGDKSAQAAWALPYRYTPSSPPNAAGVRAALGRLDGTQGLTNKDEARSKLQALMKKINPDYEPGNHADPVFTVDTAQLLAALKEGYK